MKSHLLACASMLVWASAASAQIVIRAPFVRVQVGGPGVYVRAPFVNLYVPESPPVYSVAPRTIVSPPSFVAPMPAPWENGRKPTPPPPRPKSELQKAMPPADDDLDAAPPVPATPERVLTLEEFAKAFQPKAGSYEVTLQNPVTRQPTTVQFTLPEGTPRRVNLSRRELEFDYGPRRYVKIQFDQDGAEVHSR
jgi:hypothetical protein